MSEIKSKLENGKDLRISDDEILSELFEQLKNAIVQCSEKYKINLAETLTHELGVKINKHLFIKYLMIIINKDYLINVIHDEILKQEIIKIGKMKGWDFETILE